MKNLRKATLRVARIRRRKLKTLALHVDRTRAAWWTARDEASRLFKIAKKAHDEFVAELSRPGPISQPRPKQP